MKFKPPVNALTFIGAGFSLFGFIALFIGLFFWPLLPIAAALFLLGSVPTILGWVTARERVYQCRSCGFVKSTLYAENRG